ncbi:MAG: hypothetical protein ABW321_30030, partial [Polyangiales bacterium]
MQMRSCAWWLSVLVLLVAWTDPASAAPKKKKSKASKADTAEVEPVQPVAPAEPKGVDELMDDSTK